MPAVDHSDLFGADIVDQVLLVRVDQIDMGERLRPIDPAWARALGQVMLRDGQQTPIEVCRLTARGGQSVAYITELAATLGYTIRVVEFRPSRAGAMRAGTRVRSRDWAFAFRVDVLPSGLPGGSRERRFRAGASRAGERLRTFGSPALECVIRRVAPAHATAIFAYPAAAEAAFLFDFTA